MQVTVQVEDLILENWAFKHFRKLDYCIDVKHKTPE